MQFQETLRMIISNKKASQEKRQHLQNLIAQWEAIVRRWGFRLMKKALAHKRK